MDMADISSFTAEGILAKAASLSNEPLVRSWELEPKLKSLHQTLAMIQDITREAAEQPQDPREVVASWVQKLKDVANDADDVLEEINYEVLRHKHEIQNHLKRKVLNFFSLSNPVALRLKTALKIKSINASLVDLASQASSMALFSKNIDATSQAMKSPRETNSSIGNEIIVGRDDAVSNIVATLTNSKDEENLCVMAIVGMPGLGKTTLAKLVYNEDAISQQFDKKIWIYVSNTFDVDLILSRILECVNCGTVDIQSPEAVLKSLQEQLMEKRCLLVLDDVWNEDFEEWSKLMICLSKLHFARGSTILVTTRSSKVATITGTLPRYDLEFLSEDECWSILKGRAFVDNTAPTDPDLEKVGREIAKKCAGLPPVAKVFGGMLHSKNGAHQWTAILESRIWDSPEAEEMIISELKLSLDNLKFPFLKQCFTYCSMFKKGSEIERDDLIQLWMAQGLLCPSYENSDLEMEDIGTEHFHILLQNSLLQDLTKDAFGVVAKCKMHVLVHDFAELVSKSDSTTSDSNEMVGTLKIRHASHIPLGSIPKESLRGLRSLFSNSEVPSDMLPRFRGLHVLNLYNANIKDLPKSIGMLKQLRYLNVSRTVIEAIPKSVGKLHNLQTLRMEYCRRLKVFPKEIGDLINLRHIYFGPVQKKKRSYFGWHRESHVGVGQLTNLRKMPYFIVSPDGIGRRIEELAGLNYLKGELAIYDLEHVRDGEEAKKSNLVGKRNIRKLSLVWGEEMRPCNNSEEDVLQGLQPHPNLEILEILNFMGAQFPSWKPHNNLKEIRLLQCDVCEEAPMLGHLPSLMHLEFNTMCNLKRLGDEFYGYDDVDDAMKTKALFPALKTFRISAAPNLTEWIEPPVVKEKQISVFPRLEELDLVECPQMRNFPDHFASLCKLEMSICHELSSITSLLQKCTSLQNLEISSCDKLRSLSLFGLTSIRKLLFSSRGGGLPSTSLHRLSELYTPVSLEELYIKCPNLENLEVSRCDSLISISIHGITSLRRLKISSCDGLRSMDLQGLPECYTSIEVLSLMSCRSLESISSLHGCTSLHELTIEDCDGLKTCVSIGLESCTSIRALRVHDYQQFKQYSAYGVDISLIEELAIYNCPKQICISSPGLTTLRKLVLIASCGPELSIGNSTTLEELNLQDCTSLGSLCIYNCERLSHFSVDGLDTLTILEEVTIRNCPSLTFIPITPCLRGLVIEGCEKLSTLPSGLKHCNSLERVKISGSPNLLSIPITPCLRELVIEGCEKLSSLSSGSEHCNALERVKMSGVPNLLSIPITPCLRELVIEGCEKLSSLPSGLKHCNALERLKISGSRNLVCIPISDVFPPSLGQFVIEDCAQLSSLPGRHESLEELSIVNCPELQWSSVADKGRSLTALRRLVIASCSGPKIHMDSIGTLEEISLHDCTSLVDLEIGRCKNLISLADVDVTSLQSLSNIEIRDCEKLQYLPTGLRTLTRLKYLSIGGFWEELDSFPVSQIPSSGILLFYGWPKLKSLPQVISHSTSPVTELRIFECDGLETLPEWLGDLTSLYTLHICNCENLKSLPSAQAMQRLTQVTFVFIDGCPILKERCARGTGTEWPKISHFPAFTIFSIEDSSDEDEE